MARPASSLLLLFFLLTFAVTGVCRAANFAGDLRILADDYLARSPAFSPQALREARARLADLERQADRLTPLEFYLAVSRITALADNGHDSVMRSERSWNPTLRLPLRMIWFDDGIAIARAAPEHRDLLGAKVSSIDGNPPGRLMQAFRGIQGGTDAYRRWTVAGLLHSPEALHALGIARRADRVTLTLQRPDGTTVGRTVQALPVDRLPSGVRPQAYWYTAALLGEAERGWSFAAPADRVPLYLQEPGRWFRMQDLPDMRALYVQFRSNMDEEGSAIAPFVQEVTRRLETNPPRHLVLDLRFDTGGDNTQNLELMRTIARTVPGQIYVLLGNYTFSAGIASAAALEHEGRERVTLVGEAVGDRLRWWSEHEMACLPASGLCVSVNRGLWDLRRGCHADAHCYGDQFDVGVASLEPDRHAPVRVGDWLAGIDPGLDAVRADLARIASRR